MNQKDERFSDIFSKVAAKMGTSSDQLKKAANANPQFANALKKLSQEDINKINSIINDKEASAKILATPQAQEIIKKLKKQ